MSIAGGWALLNYRRIKPVFLMLSSALVLSVGMVAGSKKPEKIANIKPFPDAFLSVMDQGDRFRNKDYFSILAADGITTADAHGLYRRIVVATERGENYKALYLARLFTKSKPDLAEGWANRASIAALLGLREESAACQSLSEHPFVAHEVPLGVLPGDGLQTRPVNLSDWAAAMALIADGLSAKVGLNQIVSVRDDVSGIHVSTLQELSEENDALAKYDLPPTGPWARSENLLLKDVLSNLFSLSSGTPMKEKSVNSGSLLAATALAGLAGMQQDPNYAAQASKLSGAMVERAFSIPSKYGGGEFTAITFPGGSPYPETFRPKPSGAAFAVGNPLPLLWASGSSLSPVVLAQIRGTRKSYSNHIRQAELNNAKAGKKVYVENLPPLYYPRLASFRYHQLGNEKESTTSIAFTIFELMLKADDLKDMFPTLPLWQQTYDLRPYEEHYRSGDLELLSNNAAATLAGYDDKGTVYKSGVTPTNWMLSPSVTK